DRQPEGAQSESVECRVDRGLRSAPAAECVNAHGHATMMRNGSGASSLAVRWPNDTKAIGRFGPRLGGFHVAIAWRRGRDQGVEQFVRRPRDAVHGTLEGKRIR